MKTGICICAWNCRGEVERATRSAFDTCAATNSDFKIFVHDDSSEIEPIESAFLGWGIPKATYYRSPKRGGLTGAWNRCIRWAITERMDHIVLCNQDILFVPGWMERFLDAIEFRHALSPLTNSPGLHSHAGSLQKQDIRGYIPELVGKEFEPEPGVLSMIMNRIEGNQPVQVEGIKGFFMAFQTEWLVKNRISDNEFFDMRNSGANGGVGGSENEIFLRTGEMPWIATNFYIHHFRPYRGEWGARDYSSTSCWPESRDT